MFRVIAEFADLHDDNHVYRVGDKYPRTRKRVAKKRLDELMSSNNKIGRPLIEKVEEK